MTLGDAIGSRAQLFSKLQEMTGQPEVNPEAQPFALLLIKLGHFRRFNALKGYQAGDQLLAEFSASLQSIRRPQDYLAKVGNAEFVLILNGLNHEGFARLASTRVLENLKTPLQVNGENTLVQANIGISLFPEHGSCAEELMRGAESALEQAKRHSHSFYVYHPKHINRETSYWDIQYELSRAIELDQLEMHFQPQVRLASGKLFGVEALIRWKHDQKGYVSPDEFIPVAEMSGQITRITEWTLNSALWFMKEWERNYPPIKVAVNISPLVLAEPEFEGLVNSTVNLYGVDCQNLTFEITESALVENMFSSALVLEALRKTGINISIDDFGTGYSSLAYFKNLPATELKIDKSFIQNMLENSMDQHIVKTIIRLGKGFDLDVVAEGVEDRISYDLLKVINCDIAQGYFIAKPMPREDFVAWVRDNSAAF